MSHELLPDDLLWAEGGHASDVVLTALADGQTSIVPKEVRSHVERCPSCAMHLGNAALLSLHVGAELEAKKKHETVPERRPLPRLAIVLGLLVAALGMLPTILAGDGALGLADVPVLARAARTLLRHLPDEASLVVLYGGSLLLVVVALAATRLLPKKEVSR